MDAPRATVSRTGVTVARLLAVLALAWALFLLYKVWPSPTAPATLNEWVGRDLDRIVATLVFAVCFMPALVALMYALAAGVKTARYPALKLGCSIVMSVLSLGSIGVPLLIAFISRR